MHNQLKKRKKKKQSDYFEIDEESDHPIHEEYVKEEPVKK